MSVLHPWFMWLFTALFFSFQFIVRVFLGLCVPELMDKFQVNATEFGLLSSMYYYGYAGMQIPMALLLDRFGPKLIVSVCCFICSASMILFYWTENWYLLLFARFLIGATSAAGFLGTFKVISLWFPVSSYSKMFALTNTVGLLGAVYGGNPLSYLISIYGWHNVLFIMGIIGLFLAATLFTLLKPYSVILSRGDISFVKNFKSLFSMPLLFFIALGNLLMVGPLEGFADIWGVSYLTIVFSFEKTDASLITSCIFTGMLVGGPILAYFSRLYAHSYHLISLCGVLMAALFAIMLLSNGSLNYIVLSLMMFIVGILCCYQVLIFSIGASTVPLELRNMTIAFLNCVNMLGGIFFHVMIGTLMDTFWSGELENGHRTYTAVSYEYAMWVIPLAAFIGGMLFLFLQPFFKPKTIET